jgi:pilus assembly protein Flp/PilA
MSFDRPILFSCCLSHTLFGSFVVSGPQCQQAIGHLRKKEVNSMFKRFVYEEEGQTLIEYGLLIGLLALVIVAAVTFFGRRVSNNLYGTSANALPF